MSSLESLEVGDEVRIKGCGAFGAERIGTITRKTAKQTIVDKERFWTKNGHVVGGSTWSNKYAYPVTDDDRDRIQEAYRRNKAVFEVKRIRFNDLSTDQLVRITEILKEDK